MLLKQKQTFLKKFAKTKGNAVTHAIINYSYHYLLSGRSKCCLEKGGLIEYNKVASTKYNELPLSEKKLSEEMIVEPRGERWKGIFWLILKNMWEIFLHVISYLHMFPML